MITCTFSKTELFCILQYGNKRRLSSFDLMYGKNTGNKNNQNVQRRSTGKSMISVFLT